MKTDAEALQWEKVHVFISSTFNDMHAERDYLVKRVFPELQDWCERRKLRLMDIDLRWGVTEQDATHNKNVVKVCLHRIDDCRPFFLCFLGQRRGWVPKEGEVSDETFATFPDLKPFVGAASVTEMEVLHALINPFHQSLAGKTEKPAEHYERAKYSFFYLRDPSYLSQLPEEPQMLRETYTNEWVEDAAERAAHDVELKRWREQEIPKSNRPCHLYTAKWDPDEKTPELMIPLQSPSPDSANINRWQRQWQKAGVTATGLNLTDDRVEASRAREFNARVSTGRLSDFNWEKAPLSHVIIKELQAAIAERFPDHLEVEDESELQKEIDQQEQFLFTASEGFIAREGDFAELDEYVESDSNQLFVLTAAGGMGKSTLLTNWIDRYRKRSDGRADHSIHFRFVGQSDGTTTVYSLLRLLLSEIKEVAQKFDEEIPLDPIKLRNELPALLAAIGKRGKTVIVMDAVNQLESGLSDVGWLPRQLPDNIKLIVSFKRGDEAAEKLYERFREGGQVKLSEVKPFADIDDRRRLVRAYLSQYLKELDQEQLETLIGLRGAENPLYLKVVLSELRVFGAHGNLMAKIRSDFGDTPVSGFARVLERLENDPAYSPIDPKRAVPLLFGLLAHARRGLSVDELTSLFIQALGRVDTAQSREDAADTVNLFLRQVRSFLARREGRYDFFFESFKGAAQRCYVTDGDEETSSKRSYQEWHRILADYFGRLPTWQEDVVSSQKPRQPMLRKVSELPHHLVHAEMSLDLEGVLCDLDFIEAKCTAALTSELIADYQFALANGREKRWHSTDLIAIFSRFVRGQAHILLSHPSLTFQQAANQPDDSPMCLAAESRWLRRVEKRPWLRCTNKSQTSSSSVMIIAAHDDTLNACRFSPDGMLIVSASDDATLKLWDSLTGAHILTFSGHDSAVNDCAFSPNGGLVLSASDDGTMRLWEVETGVQVRIVQTDDEAVRFCAFSQDGCKIISLTKSSAEKVGRLTVWDARTFCEVQTLPVKNSGGFRSALSPDSRFFIASGHWKKLFLFDLSHNSLASERTWESKQKFSWPRAAAFSPDNYHYVSAHIDRTLRLWSLDQPWERAAFSGHQNHVTACSFSPDGTLVASGSEDRTVRIWNVGTRKMVKMFHCNYTVSSCEFSPDGKRIMSADADGGALQLWDLSTLDETTKDLEVAVTIEDKYGHVEKVDSLYFFPDRSRILSKYEAKTCLWDGYSGDPIHEQGSTIWKIADVAISPDGEHALLVGGEYHGDKTRGRVLFAGLMVIDPAGGAIRSVFPAYDKEEVFWEETKPGGPPREVVDVFTGNDGPLTACAFSPDGSHILSAGRDGSVQLWNIVSGYEGATLIAPKSEVEAVSFSPDGLRVMSSFQAGDLCIWDLPSAQCTATLPAYAGCFSPDGRLIAAAFRDGWLRLLETDSGNDIGVFQLPQDEWWGRLAFSIDGGSLYIERPSGTLEIWDVETRLLVGDFRHPTGNVQGNDRHRRAASYSEGRLHLYQLEGIAAGVPITTAWRHRRTWYVLSKRLATSRYAVACPLCLAWFRVPSKALGSKTSCRHCGNVVRINSFTLDADWQPKVKWRESQPSPFWLQRNKQLVEAKRRLRPAILRMIPYALASIALIAGGVLLSRRFRFGWLAGVPMILIGVLYSLLLSFPFILNLFGGIVSEQCPECDGKAYLLLNRWRYCLSCRQKV